MTAVTATALAPELTVRTIDRGELAAVHRDLEAAVRRVTPQLESTGAGVIYASFSGLSRRYEDAGEGGFLDDLRDAALDLELPARLGMASCRFVARCAAILEPSEGFPILVPSGTEADFLAPLPLRFLPDALDEVAALESLGLRSLGELAELPPAGLTRRFGARAALLQRLARGQDRSELIPSPEPQRFFHHTHADFPIAQLEPLLFFLRRPLSLLLGELDGQALAAGALRWELQLEDHPPLEGCARAASPSVSMRLWSELLKLDLERNDLLSGVLSATLEARDVVPHRPDQERMLGPRQAPPGALSRTLAHLATELGEDAFGLLRPRPALLPEQREEWAAAGSFSEERRSSRSSFEPWLPLPEKGGCAPVAYRPESPHLPIEVRQDRRGIHSLKHRFGRLDVLRTQGPWDISGSWWDAPVRRRYFQVASRDAVAWIYFEPDSRCWFLAGWLD
jgi:protein ImuB